MSERLIEAVLKTVGCNSPGGSNPSPTAKYMLLNTMYFTMLRKRKNRRGPKHTGLTTLAVSQKVTRVEYDTAAWSEHPVHSFAYAEI